MTPDEQKRADAAAKKRAYRQRKREELARQAPPEELTTMFNLQAHNIAPELEEKWRNAESDSRIYPMPDSDGRALPPGMPYQEKKGYHDIVHEALVEAVDSADEQTRDTALRIAEKEQDYRERAQAVISEAEERSRRLDLIMANHNRIRSNPSELMWEILKLLNLMRMELTDLIGNK